MKRHSRAGISDVVVVMLVLFALLLAAPAITLYTRIAAKKETHAQIETRINRQVEHQTKIAGEIRAALVPGGFDPELETADMKQAAKTAALSAKNFLQGGADGNVWADFLALFDDEEELGYPKDFTPKTLQQMVLKMIPPVDLVQLSERVTRTTELVADKAKETAEEIGPKLKDEYVKLLQEINADIAEVDAKQQKENATFTQESNARNAATQDLRTKKDEIQLAYAIWERKVKNEISSLQFDLDEFKRKEAVNFARITDVGEVLRTSTNGKTVWIKLGSRDGVVAGMRFKVGNKGIHGSITDKGRIEVLRVYPEMAEASVTRLTSARSPILAGDRLANPFFHPRRSVVVQILGPERASGLMSRPEAENRIEAIGGTVRDRFSTDLDFVVVMTEDLSDVPEDAAAEELAKRMDVPIYSAEDLFPYLEE